MIQTDFTSYNVGGVLSRPNLLIPVVLRSVVPRFCFSFVLTGPQDLSNQDRFGDGDKSTVRYVKN